jgi:hypothetical protein
MSARYASSGICKSTIDSGSKQMNCSFALSRMALETNDSSSVDVSARWAASRVRHL